MSCMYESYIYHRFELHVHGMAAYILLHVEQANYCPQHTHTCTRTNYIIEGLRTRVV